MALKITANTGSLTAREKQFLKAIADLYIMMLYGQLRAKNCDVADKPEAEDAIKGQAAIMLATKFSDLGIEVVDKEVKVAPDKMLLN